MDFDEIRRKRVKLFNFQSATTGGEPSSLAVEHSNMADEKPKPSTFYGHDRNRHRHQIGYGPNTLNTPVAPDITDDERYARELQAEIEREEQHLPQVSGGDAPGWPSHLTKGPTEDEKAAYRLQEKFARGYDSAEELQDDPFDEYSEVWESIAEDEKIARELQAKFDHQLDYEPSPPLPTPAAASGGIAKLLSQSKSTPDRVKAQDIDTTDDAVTVREFAIAVAAIDCQSCNCVFNLDHYELMKLFHSTVVQAGQEVDFFIVCPACSSKTCLGCGSAMTAAGSSYGSTTRNDIHLKWHCDHARLALIWSLLCGFDNVAHHNKPQAKSTSVPTTPPERSFPGQSSFKGKKKGVAGVGYSSGNYHHHKDDYETDEDDEPLWTPHPLIPVADTTLGLQTPSTQHTLMPAYTLFPPMPSQAQPGLQPPPAQYGPQPLSSQHIPQPAALPFAPPLPGMHFGQLPHPTHFGPQPPSQQFALPPPLPAIQYGPQSSSIPIAPQHPYMWTDPWPDKPSKSLKPLKPPKRYKLKAKKSAPSPVDPDDSITTHVLSLLSATLPAPDRQLPPTQFDSDPPQPLLSILRRSSILDRAAELLHNDSLDNTTQRFSLYDSLIAFMRTLQEGGKTLSSLIHEPRHINKLGHDLLKVSFDSPTRIQNESIDTAKSLASCMENLACQSARMLTVMSGSKEDVESEEEQQLLLLCTMITECATAIRQTGTLSKKSTTESPQKASNDWQKDMVILPIDDEVILQFHYFGSAARGLLDISNAPRHRMAHIFKEIVTLETSLPPGIFVRYGETRPDVMKIIIIGPQGTPYENGIFEFDVFCPLDYPNVPPKMQLKTTGGGTVGFNPNLYSDGKVCLSILGTWQGETWEPNKSTLLQVFVSIQAMIFCEEPWCNEPGREIHRGTEASKQLNRYLHPNVVKYAMIEWIESKRSKAPMGGRGGGRRLGAAKDDKTSRHEADIWAEVARLHFQATGDAIVETVCSWANDKPPAARRARRRTRSAGPGASGASVSPFATTGRTLGAGEDEPAPTRAEAPLVFEPSRLTQPTLAAKLEEVLKELQGNSKGVHYDAFSDEDFE